MKEKLKVMKEKRWLRDRGEWIRRQTKERKIERLLKREAERRRGKGLRMQVI